MKDETVNPNQTARKLLNRMQQDMAMLQRRREAREKIAPLLEQMTDAYYRFPQFGQGQPTDLHVSPEIWQKLSEYLTEEGKPADLPADSSIFVLGNPVTAVGGLQGFRWVQARPNSWVCGPVHEVR